MSRKNRDYFRYVVKYFSDIANKYGIKVGEVKKLVPNLRDKVKYIVYYSLQIFSIICHWV